MNGDKSRKFETETGVKQGDILSPRLFIILMDMLLNYIRKKTNQWMGSAKTDRSGSAL